MHYVNNKNKFEAVDPKDTAIIALTIKLNSLEEKLRNQGGSNSGKGGSGSSSGDNNKKGKTVIKTISKTMDYLNGAQNIKAQHTPTRERNMFGVKSTSVTG
eukprot:4359289-Ditylum_brightwellii.AAC.1